MRKTYEVVHYGYTPLKPVKQARNSLREMIEGLALVGGIIVLALLSSGGWIK